MSENSSFDFSLPSGGDTVNVSESQGVELERRTTDESDVTSVLFSSPRAQKKVTKDTDDNSSLTTDRNEEEYSAAGRQRFGSASSDNVNSPTPSSEASTPSHRSTATSSDSDSLVDGVSFDSLFDGLYSDSNDGEDEIESSNGLDGTTQTSLEKENTIVVEDGSRGKDNFTRKKECGYKEDNKDSCSSISSDQSPSDLSNSMNVSSDISSSSADAEEASNAQQVGSLVEGTAIGDTPVAASKAHDVDSPARNTRSRTTLSAASPTATSRDGKRGNKGNESLTLSTSPLLTDSPAQNTRSSRRFNDFNCQNRESGTVGDESATLRLKRRRSAVNGSPAIFGQTTSSQPPPEIKDSPARNTRSRTAKAPKISTVRESPSSSGYSQDSHHRRKSTRHEVAARSDTPARHTFSQKWGESSIDSSESDAAEALPVTFSNRRSERRLTADTDDLHALMLDLQEDATSIESENKSIMQKTKRAEETKGGEINQPCVGRSCSMTQRKKSRLSRRRRSSFFQPVSSPSLNCDDDRKEELTADASDLANLLVAAEDVGDNLVTKEIKAKPFTNNNQHPKVGHSRNRRSVRWSIAGNAYGKANVRKGGTTPGSSGNGLASINPSAAAGGSPIQSSTKKHSKSSKLEASCTLNDTFDAESPLLSPPSMVTRKGRMPTPHAKVSDYSEIELDSSASNNDLSGSFSIFSSSKKRPRGVPKSILNSGRKKLGTSPTPRKTRRVAFGSPVAAEYNRGSPSVSMTPLPSKRVKEMFLMPSSTSEGSSTLNGSLSPVADDCDGNEENTIQLETDINALLLNAQGADESTTIKSPIAAYKPESSESSRKRIGQNGSEKQPGQHDQQDEMSKRLFGPGSDTPMPSSIGSVASSASSSRTNPEKTIALEGNISELLRGLGSMSSDMSSTHESGIEASPTNSVDLVDAESLASLNVHPASSCEGKSSLEDVGSVRSERLDFEAVERIQKEKSPHHTLSSSKEELGNSVQNEKELKNDSLVKSCYKTANEAICDSAHKIAERDHTVELERDASSLIAATLQEERDLKFRDASAFANTTKMMSNLVVVSNRLSFGVGLSGSDNERRSSAVDSSFGAPDDCDGNPCAQDEKSLSGNGVTESSLDISDMDGCATATLETNVESLLDAAGDDSDDESRSFKAQDEQTCNLETDVGALLDAMEVKGNDSTALSIAGNVQQRHEKDTGSELTSEPTSITKSPKSVEESFDGNSTVRSSGQKAPPGIASNNVQKDIRDKDDCDHHSSSEGSVSQKKLRSELDDENDQTSFSALSECYDGDVDTLGLYLNDETTGLPISVPKNEYAAQSTKDAKLSCTPSRLAWRGNASGKTDGVDGLDESLREDPPPDSDLSTTYKDEENIENSSLINLSCNEILSAGNVSRADIDLETFLDSCIAATECENKSVVEVTNKILNAVCAEVESKAEASVSAGQRCLSSAIESNGDAMLQLQLFVRRNTKTLGTFENCKPIKNLEKLSQSVQDLALAELYIWEAQVTEALNQNIAHTFDGVDEISAMIDRHNELVDKAHESIACIEQNAARKAKRRSLKRRKSTITGLENNIELLEKQLHDAEASRNSIVSEVALLSRFNDQLKGKHSTGVPISELKECCANKEKQYKMLAGLFCWSPIVLNPTTLILRFRPSIGGMDLKVSFALSTLGPVTCTATMQPTAESRGRISKDKYLADFAGEKIAAICKEFHGTTLSAPRDVGCVVPKLEWKLQRLGMIANEIHALQCRYETVLEQEKDGHFLLKVNFTSLKAPTKVRACFNLNDSYPNSPVDACLQPLIGASSKSISSLSSRLLKNASPGFGYITRMCDVISAFLS